MSKAAPFLSSFNAGEMSPRMDARTDFEKYAAAISRGLNLICLPQGGVTFRPGSRFIKETKTSSTVSTLIPFEPVSTRSYMIEAGDHYFRFYRNQGWLLASTVAAIVVNGTFASDISGWTNRSTGGGGIIWSAGSMAISGAADGYGWTEQALAIAPADLAKNHVIQFQLTGNYGSHATVQIGTGGTLSDLFRATGMGMGWHTISITPGLTPVYFQVINEQSDTIHLDSVSVMSGVPVELPTPYAAVHVSGIRKIQSGDVAYLFHDSYPPHKLERRGDTTWSLVRVFFQDGPWLGINPDTDLGGTNLIRNSRFDSGSAGWSYSGSGTGFVDYNSSSRTVLLRNTGTGAGSAGIEQPVVTGAPNKTHVIHFDIVGGGTVTFQIGTATTLSDVIAPTSLGAGWYSYSFTPTVSPFYVQFTVGSTTSAIAGGVGAAFCYNTSSRLLQASATRGFVTVTALGDFKPFTTLDIGRLIRLEHAGREAGWGIIAGFTSSQVVTVQTYRDFASTAPVETWRLGAWSDSTGWPHTATLYQQRLLVARNASRPQTIWGSQSADFENMRPDAWVAGASTVLDTSALNFTLSAAQIKGTPTILWIAGSRLLVIGTAAGQWAVSSKGPALTPSDFSANPQTSVRSLDIQPEQVDTAIIFAQRAKRGIYELGYSFQVDSFTASDVTILSDHITKGNVAQITYQAEPLSNVWVRLETGTLGCMTYKRGQNVVGWTPIVLGSSLGGGAVVEAIATIPGDSDSSQTYSSINRDELWMIVSRTIGGVTKRYIEMMEGYFDGPNRAEYTDKNAWVSAMRAAQVDAFHVDCGLTYRGGPTTSISGLSHLEGETVAICADGAQQASRTVTGGAITLDTPASTVHVGLGYSWLYRGMKLPFGSANGPGVGDTKQVHQLTFVLRDAATFSYAVDHDSEDLQNQPVFKDVVFRTPADPMTGAVALFTGEYPEDADGGYDTDPRIVMKGSVPLPWTLLGIAPRVAQSAL